MAHLLLSNNEELVADGPFTYADLAELIEKMSPEQRECNISIYDSTVNEFHVVTCFCIVQETDVLDEGHPYLEI